MWNAANSAAFLLQQLLAVGLYMAYMWLEHRLLSFIGCGLYSLRLPVVWDLSISQLRQFTTRPMGIS